MSNIVVLAEIRGGALKRASLDESGSKDYWQAGKSAGVIDSIRPAGDIVREFGAAIG